MILFQHKNRRKFNTVILVGLIFKQTLYGLIVCAATAGTLIEFKGSAQRSPQAATLIPEPRSSFEKKRPVFTSKDNFISPREIKAYLSSPLALQNRLEYSLGENQYGLFKRDRDPSIISLSNQSGKRPAKRTKRLIAIHFLRKKHRLYHSIILKAAHRHEVDPALVQAIIMAESGYNPKAISKSGAKGLMQLMPGTAKALGIKDIFDPEHNIEGGVRYFKKLVDKFDGDVKLALAAYNAGTRKVKKYKGVPPFKATRFYIKKVLRYYKYFKENMKSKLKRT
jgi:soluble lytic murein transglycosylase-like protein